MKMTKAFRLTAEEIKPIVMGRGSCLASDEITVQGKRVGFMYRETPDDETDSGWRFFSGEETQHYADDPSNFEKYDVNTVANYDPTIIDFLDSPMMAAFERNAISGKLEKSIFPIAGLK